MTDITVTPANVVPAANAAIARGIAGAAILAGQVVYADPASTPVGLIKPATQAAIPAANIVGIAVNSAPAANQPVEYQTAGDLAFGAILAQGKVYVQGSGSGGISLSADLDSAAMNTRYGTVVGVATSTSSLRVGLVLSGVLRP